MKVLLTDGLCQNDISKNSWPRNVEFVCIFIIRLLKSRWDGFVWVHLIIVVNNRNRLKMKICVPCNAGELEGHLVIENIILFVTYLKISKRDKRK